MSEAKQNNKTPLMSRSRRDERLREEPTLKNGAP